MSDHALVESPQKTRKVHNGKGSRLTHEQLESLVSLHRLDKTQTEIAEAIGCDQGTVSRYLQALTPTGSYAGAFLRAQAGTLAEKFMDRAKGSDILDFLGRIEAIPASVDAGKGGITVVIGGNANVQINALAPSENT